VLHVWQLAWQTGRVWGWAAGARRKVHCNLSRGAGVLLHLQLSIDVTLTGYASCDGMAWVFGPNATLFVPIRI